MAFSTQDNDDDGRNFFKIFQMKQRKVSSVINPTTNPGDQWPNQQQMESDSQQQLMAQQLLMLLPGSKRSETPPLDTSYCRPSPATLVPSLPPGAAAELGALLFADVVRKQLMEQAVTGEIVGTPPTSQSLDLMYRHLTKNQQQSPMAAVLSTSDIANKVESVANSDSPTMTALQYDAFPNQKFGNTHQSPNQKFGNTHQSVFSSFSDPKPSTSTDEQAVLEIDARALLAAFLHCLTSDLKRNSANSSNSDGTGSDSTPISVESDEDLPPKNNAKNRGSQQRRSSIYASGSSDDNNASPKSSDGGVNSSSSSTASSKRSKKAGSNACGSTSEREDPLHPSTSVSSSPPVNSNGGHGESSETIVQELVEEATTIKQQQVDTSSKVSVNESGPFFWVQSFHAFERRNLIRTCLMQPPSQMTFDPRRQCFRRVPAVTLYRCNVCGDYTSKHRDKISRHLTLQHSIKPTPLQSSPTNSATKTVADGGNNKAHGETSPSNSSMSVSNSSPTWPANQAPPAVSTAQPVFQWPPPSTTNRLSLAIATDSQPFSNQSSSNAAPMDLTSTNGSGTSKSNELGRTLLTVGGIIETAFYQAAAASSSSPSPPLSINEVSNSSSPAKKKKASISNNGLDLTSAGGDESAFKRVKPNVTTVDNNEKREFSCHYCSATFRLYVALRTHYAQHHPTTTSARPYNCNMCDFSTTQLRKLDQHQQQHHQNKQPSHPMEQKI